MPLIEHVCDSFESEMAQLGKLTSAMPPLLAGGRQEFFASLDGWLRPSADSASDIVVVLPDPSFNLSLPYPEDELSFAAGANNGNGASHADSLEALIDDAGLGEGVLGRPVTALSGGERMLVSLIKASCLVKEGGSLVVCSPFYWLDPCHRQFAQRLLDRHASNNVTTRLVVLDGELGLGSAFENAPTLDKLEWELVCAKTTVVFPATRFPRETAEKRIRYVAPNERIQLVSPTLISGANGVGKSTFANVLAGLTKTQGPSPTAIVRGFTGSARLLLQDSVIQLFGDSPKSHLERVFRYDKKLLEKALSLFEKMQANCAKALATVNSSWPVGDRVAPNTVFQSKLALAAERLVGNAPLLILDEPGWCLSKASSQIFLHEVVKQAHQQGTAIAFISHQGNWWQNLAMSELQLSPTPNSGEVSFQRLGG